MLITFFNSLQDIPNLHYRAFVDAGWFLDIAPYDKTYTSFQEIARSLQTNYQAQFNLDCTNYYGQSESWKCFHGQYVWSHIITPVFYQQFQYDSANFAFDGISYPFKNSSQANYAEVFKKAITQEFSYVPGLFYPNCVKHESEDSTMFHSISINGTTMDTSFWNWYSQKQQPIPISTRTIDSCNSSPGCNPTCP